MRALARPCWAAAGSMGVLIGLAMPCTCRLSWFGHVMHLQLWWVGHGHQILQQPFNRRQRWYLKEVNNLMINYSHISLRPRWQSPQSVSPPQNFLLKLSCASCLSWIPGNKNKSEHHMRIKRKKATGLNIYEQNLYHIRKAEQI